MPMAAPLNWFRLRGVSATLVRYGLILILIGLATVTLYQVYVQPQPPYRVQVFKTPQGWGYDILTDKKTLIHQPIVPGQPGTIGFSSRQQARRVGERVVEKMQQTQTMPTLSTDELRQLGVTIP